MLDGVQVLIQFINQWYTRRDIQLDDVFFRNLVQVFYKGTQAVPMGSY